MDSAAATTQLPRALREADFTLRGWPGLFAHNGLRRPDEMDPVRGIVRFLDENQNVCSWGVRSDEMREDDPPVWVDDGASEPARIDDRVSAFLLKMTLLELIFSSEDLVESEDRARPASSLLEGLTRLDQLGALAWPGSDGLWFFAGDRALAMATTDREGTPTFAWRGSQ